MDRQKLSQFAALTMETITAMIECPKGINHKLDFDPESHSFKLNKILPAGLVFPFDFGMIPGTKGDDGDPLDIIVISEASGFPGMMIDCHIIGALRAEQTERNGKTFRNDRYIGVPVVSKLYENVSDIADMPKEIIAELTAFFVNYNELAGKKFKVVKKMGKDEAGEMLSKQAQTGQAT